MKRFSASVLAVWLIFGFASAAMAAAKNLCRVGMDVVIAEDMTVRHVVSIGGQVTVEGTVEGSVVAVGGSVVLGRSAVVEGDIVSVGGVIVAGRGADVQGNLTEINAANLSAAFSSIMSGEWEGWSWIFAAFSLLVFTGILIIALIVAALLPKQVRVVSAAAGKRPFAVTLWGIVALVLVVPLAALLAISVVGIVLIPLELSLFVLAALMGFIAVARLVGRKWYDLRRKPEPKLLRETCWGLVFLWLAGWIPYVGLTVKVIAVVVGLGAIIVTRFGFREA